MAKGDVGRSNHLIANFNVTNTTYGFYLNSSSYNNLSANTATNITHGFYLEGSSTNNKILNNIALNSTSGGYNWTANCINNDFTGSVAVNYLLVKVTNSLGSPINGADVEVVTDGTVIYKTPHFNGKDNKTDPNGVTSWIAVTYITGTGIDTMTINTTTVTVYYSWFIILDNSRIVDMSSSHVETFSVYRAACTASHLVAGWNTRRWQYPCLRCYKCYCYRRCSGCCVFTPLLPLAKVLKRG